MKVLVKFTLNIRSLTKTGQAIVELDKSAHLSDLLSVLATQYGDELISLLYLSEQETIDVWASIIVDGTSVPLPLIPQSDVTLREGSVVVIMSPVSGG